MGWFFGVINNTEGRPLWGKAGDALVEVIAV